MVKNISLHKQNHVVSVILLIFVLSFCTSCGNKNTNAIADSDSIETTQNSVEIANDQNNSDSIETDIILESVNEQSFEVSESYDILSMLPPGESEFDRIISSNQLDADYEREFSEAVSTVDYINVQNKYIELWKIEIDNYLNKLNNKLPLEAVETLNDAQVKWSEQLEALTEVNRTVLAEKCGGATNWLLLSDLREEYRERAIYLMCLDYYSDSNS